MGDQAILPEVAKLLTKDVDPFIRGDAIWILGETRDAKYAAAILNHALSAKPDITAGEAIVSLGKIRYKPAAKRLRELLHSEFAKKDAYVWTDSMGTRNDARKNWLLLSEAIFRIEERVGVKVSSLDHARELMPKK